MPALCCRKNLLAEWEPCLDTKALQPTHPFDVFQPIGWPYQNRSKTPPSLSGWFIFGTRSASDSSRTSPVFFHLSQKLNTPRARRANGPRLMGLLELRGAHRRKTLGFSLLLSPSLHSVCSAVPHPKLNPLQHQTASSFLTLKSRIRLLSWFYICRTANAPRAGTTNLSSSYLREHCQWQ